MESDICPMKLTFVSILLFPTPFLAFRVATLLELEQQSLST